jgi:DNA-binding transcriptional ArsR family regulator
MDATKTIQSNFLIRHASLRQIQVFESVSRHLSFTKAAQELFLTQPTVSSQVKSLVEAIGLPLYEQVGRKIYLTDVGEQVANSCREIIGKLSNLEILLDDFNYKGISFLKSEYQKRIMELLLKQGTLLKQSEEPTELAKLITPLKEVFDPTGAGDTFAGGFIGHIDKTDDISFDNMKQAIIFGSALASFCVEKFGTEMLQNLNQKLINNRVQKFIDLVQFDYVLE